MNYLADRVSFTAQERATLAPLETFLRAWEGTDNFEAALVPEPFAHVSMFGNGYAPATIARWFRALPAGTTLQLTLANYAVRTAGERAVQYATVVGLIRDQATYQHHLTFGGSFVNDLALTPDGWKIEALRFDLQCEDSVAATSLSREGLIYRAPGYGTRALAPSWKTIDDRIGHNMSAIPGAGVLAVNPEFDAPWYALAEAREQEGDEAQLRELLARYSFAFDYATFYLVRNDFAENAVLELEGERMVGRRAILGYLKMLRKVKPRTHHSLVVESIELAGDTARITAPRIAPDLCPTQRPGDDPRQWTHGRYVCDAEKQAGKWRITVLRYEQSSEQN